MKRVLYALSVAAILIFITGCADDRAAASVGSNTTSVHVDTVSEPVSAIPSDVTDFFQEYNWTVTGLLGETHAQLPDTLMTSVEDSPTQFYWMRAALLSGDIGYDLPGVLGKSIRIEVYSLSGILPEEYEPQVFQLIRGVVYRSEGGDILGSIIDSGRAGISVSLSRRTVEEIAGMSLIDYWSAHYYDPANPVNLDAEKRDAEEVIRRYFNSVASGDDAMQLSTLSVEQKLMSLYRNLDNGFPYHADPQLYGYLSGVDVLSIQRFDIPEFLNAEFTEYMVNIDARISETGKGVLEDGELVRFIRVQNENNSLRIMGDGTGP